MPADPIQGNRAGILPDFPCGCPSASRPWAEPPTKVVVINARTKQCVCGRRWSWAWYEVPAPKPKKATAKTGEAHAAYCPGCKNEIAPDLCGCGAGRVGHGDPMETGHTFVPQGCNCLGGSDEN